METAVVILELRSLVDHSDSFEADKARSGDNLATSVSTTKPTNWCTSVRLVLREEFRWRSFNLNFPIERQFYTSQWAWPKFIFLTYRLVAAAYTLTVLIYSVIETSFTKRRHPWIAYLTYWSYVVITTHLLLSAAIAAACFNRRRCCLRERPELEVEVELTRMYDIASEAAVHSAAVEPVVELRWHFRLDWILFDVASNTAILVTSVYFIAMYPNMEHLKTMSANDANFHLMNSVVMALELVVTAIPVRLLHFIYPLAFCLLYSVFSAVYWAVDHENTLYPGVLDWNNAPMAGVMVLITSVFLIPCNSAINFLAYQLRLSIHRKLNK